MTKSQQALVSRSQDNLKPFNREVFLVEERLAGTPDEEASRRADIMEKRWNGKVSKLLQDAESSL